MISYLCVIAGVSRSGYYAWLSARSKRVERLEEDWKYYQLINEVFKKKRQKVGAPD